MRAVRMLLLLAGAALAAPPEDYTMREGSGWAGFLKGSWIKVKTSLWIAGRAPSVSVTTSRLVEVTADALTIEMSSVEALTGEEKSRLVLPARGEAGPGEKEERLETLGDEAVFACGKSMACGRSRVTVTGKDGKRVVTLWTAREPRVVVKRVVETFDAKGAIAGMESWLLTSLAETHTVEGRQLRCLAYATRSKDARGDGEGTALVSRSVPQQTVRFDLKMTREGVTTYTLAVQLLDFEAK
ncbi:MAG: hypothetical protein ACT4PV_02465 [Planctomycetaceae bacterium]